MVSFGNKADHNLDCYYFVSVWFIACFFRVFSVQQIFIAIFVRRSMAIRQDLPVIFSCRRKKRMISTREWAIYGAMKWNSDLYLLYNLSWALAADCFKHPLLVEWIYGFRQACLSTDRLLRDPKTLGKTISKIFPNRNPSGDVEKTWNLNFSSGQIAKCEYGGDNL